MSDYQLKTPVAFIIFNRSDTTERVFAEIAKAKPPTLLVIADGPRADHPEDNEKCSAARAIIDRVDWDCEVLKNYSDINLGCKHRISTGLDWVFDTVEKAIILEDDCLPHPTFFRFCEELLEKYRDDERIMHISGTNVLVNNSKSNTYYFSNRTEIWGWATWRRAWKYYDVNISFWPTLKNTGYISNMFPGLNGMIFEALYDDAYNNKIDTWDIQWTLCRLVNGLGIFPMVNLISNVGYGKDGTHTKNKHDSRANAPTGEMFFPLEHPPCHIVNTEMDEKLSKVIAKNNYYYIIKIILNNISNYISKLRTR